MIYLLFLAWLACMYFVLRGGASMPRKDRFLEQLYQRHRDIWLALGGPSSWRWAPPGGEKTPAYPTLFFDWFSTAEPVWLSKTPELRAEYYALRKEQRAWFIGGGLSFVLSVIVGVCGSLLGQL